MAFSSPEEMYASIGYGAVSVNQVLFKLIDYYRKEVPQPIVQPTIEGRHTKGSVTIKGMTGLMVSFAGCCSPVPGDDIIGFVTRGRGVVVHRKDCPNLIHADPERLQPAEWVTDEGGARFKAAIVVKAEDQGIALAAVSGCVAEMKLAITSINGRYDKAGDAIVEVTVSLTNRQDVEVLIKKIKSHAKIYDVRRLST
jgi:GTP pyrophosphokinase